MTKNLNISLTKHFSVCMKLINFENRSMQQFSFINRRFIQKSKINGLFLEKINKKKIKFLLLRFWVKHNFLTVYTVGDLKKLNKTFLVLS